MATTVIRVRTQTAHRQLVPVFAAAARLSSHNSRCLDCPTLKSRHKNIVFITFVGNATLMFLLYTAAAHATQTFRASLPEQTAEVVGSRSDTRSKGRTTEGRMTNCCNRSIDRRISRLVHVCTVWSGPATLQLLGGGGGGHCVAAQPAVVYLRSSLQPPNVFFGLDTRIFRCR